MAHFWLQFVLKLWSVQNRSEQKEEKKNEIYTESFVSSAKHLKFSFCTDLFFSTVRIFRMRQTYLCFHLFQHFWASTKKNSDENEFCVKNTIIKTGMLFPSDS